MNKHRSRLLSVLALSAIFLGMGSVHGEATPSTAYSVSGLSKPVEILVDEFGIPHMYAQDHYDAFFAQGFNAARDRLWQIDLWRRRGLGELSAVLGSRYLEQDRASRLFLYRGDMYAEWLAYGNDAKRIAQAFTAGINAFIDQIAQQPELLPPEFAMLDYKPARWQADDVVRIRSNGLWRNVVTEVWRAQLACQKQLSAAAQWKQLEPSWQTQMPAGLDPCIVPADVLDDYLLAKESVDFDPEDDPASSSHLAERFADQVLEAHRQDIGSNNWVVAPSRTSTGRPILADDPHRSHAVPSLRYVAHLVAPGLNVIGAGEPALPGISIGHNERIAFGLTIFPIDQEDLYVYEKQDDGYKYLEHVEPFTTKQESIAVRDSKPITVSMKFTLHGPVVAETKTHAFAVRAAWLEPGMAPYFGSIEYMRASNFREFVGALNRWGAPAENQVYADIDGNIGYKPAGRFPKRDNWDGLLPVPGDGSYEWDGYFDMDVLPEEYNPDRGFSGTANAMSLPADYPIADYKVGFEWSAPWRYKRLWEVLEKDDRHSMQASLDLQRDYHSILARQVIKRLPKLARSNKESGGPMLTRWDQRLEADSPAAALWNIWYSRHLNSGLATLVNARIAEVMAEEEIPLDSLTVLDLLDTKAGRKIASNTLQAAWQETKDLLGADASVWRWGDLHQIKFEHPLLHLDDDDDVKQEMSIQPYPRGGSGNTTNNTNYDPEDFLVKSGASFRMVVDVGNWDAARMTNAPGQSGNPQSKFYDNLLQNWAAEGHIPMLFSRASVRKSAVQRIELLPEPLEE